MVKGNLLLLAILVSFPMTITQALQIPSLTSQRIPQIALHMATSVRSSATSNLNQLERQIVTLGRKGQTDQAVSLYHSTSKPTIRLLNSAIDACSRAKPVRLEQAFQLLEQGISEKRLKPNVFTFGSLVSACARVNQADQALELLRSMEVSK
jgi:pentatricopeptide repeat protein